MIPDAPDRSGPNEAAKPTENMDQLLAKLDEEMKRLDDEIDEAKKKSKAVIPDPDA
jgi:ppGpp synthetase/RelA/SpoT-type nucleotidyltranferase